MPHSTEMITVAGTRLVVLAEAGHAPFDERKAAFLAAFYDFIGK